MARQSVRESAARSYARSLPIAPALASGAIVTGADGRSYLDCLSGAGTLAIGHNHPEVIAALRSTLDSGAPLHVLDMITPDKDAFTAALLALLPGELRDVAKVHFCSPAGTDAVEAALKLARVATGRSGVIAFSGGYHGMTLGAVAVSGSARMRTAAGTLDTGGIGVTRLPFPYDYRCPFGVGAPLSAELSAHLLATMLDDASSGVGRPAAVILEVVQGEGGVIPAPDRWLRAVREVTAERGVLLIVDEVQTGIGRTGTFWACERAGVTPDILVAAKAVGGGLPLAVIAYRPALDVWSPGDHTGTFRGNTLAMVAGRVTLEVVTRQRLPERAARVGAVLVEGLRSLARRHTMIGDVRGRGLMIGAEIVDPVGDVDELGARPAAPLLAAALRTAALRNGLIVELGGRADTVLRLLPPLTITDAEAQLVLDRLAAACAEVTAG
ncbi:MAG TPA: diaminobutyrate--2-oxoglutarate transaminase family protein [Pseudonocardiaceae bacterium]